MKGGVKKSVGDNIKMYRKQRGLTQEQLAQQVGVTHSMICQIERGTKAATMQLGKEIADALDVSVEELLK